VDFRDALASLDRLKREREALNVSLDDVMRELAADDLPAGLEERYRRLHQLTVRLGNYAQTERQQNDLLMELLADAYSQLINATSSTE
jgi:hypothetical protein